MDIAGALIKGVLEEKFDGGDDVLVTALDFITSTHLEELFQA